MCLWGTLLFFFVEIIFPVPIRAGNDLVAATVGIQLISNSDIAHRQAMLHCYGDSTATIEQAFMVFVNELFEQEVLRVEFGVEPPLNVLLEHARWIDDHTKDPVRLSCMKSIFRTDTAAYLRLFVEPTLVNPKLHAMYSRDASFDDWFSSVVKSRVPVYFIDANLGEKIRRKYGNVWWLK